MNENITPLPWALLKWDGDEWPERRWSIGHPFGAAIAITPRYADEQTEVDFQYLVDAANAYPALTARVKELEEENANLRLTGKSVLGLIKAGHGGSLGWDDIAEWEAALNKEPTT